MSNIPLYQNRSSVYPGEYVPLYKEGELNQTIRQCINKVGRPVKIIELGSCYKIELAIPDVKRENLFLKIFENILSVFLIRENNQYGKPTEYFFDDHYCRQIVLPENADPVFMTAEYKSGILHLFIPKSENPLKRIDTKIAVY